MKTAKNLISRVRNLLTGVHRSAPSRRRTQSYEHVLEYLQHFCSTLPAGTEIVFLLNGRNGEVRWRERTARLEPTPNEPEPPKQPAAAEVVHQEPATAAAEVPSASVTTDGKPSKQQQTMQKLLRFLHLRYAFRYNRLTEQTECAVRDASAADERHLIYKPVDNRLLNSIALAAIAEGIDCWDRDVRRYVESDNVPGYHPFARYFDTLPAWDGRDRVTPLAARVSDNPLWVRSFHRWMLALTAGWMGHDTGGKRANSVAPILVSPVQGMGKSTFCRLLMPAELRRYFTESFDLSNPTAAENKLAAFGLINLDEFDKLPATRMPQLKNLMQMENLNLRRAYRRSTEPLERIASFIGTSNRRDLLTDASGSRRFICVEVEHEIDCTTPVEHAQLYAQLKHELQQGERCWFSKREEAEIQAANQAFYRVTPAEEVLGANFQFARPGEQGARVMSAAALYAALKQQNPSALTGYSCLAFSRLLAQLGRRVHTRYGNGYWVKEGRMQEGEGMDK